MEYADPDVAELAPDVRNAIKGGDSDDERAAGPLARPRVPADNILEAGRI